jgi:hypothetical protein
MQIRAHDENSLTNLLFSEVHRHGKVRELLAAIRWRSHTGLPFGVATVELHHQLGLSDFGKPDVVLLVTDDAGDVHLVVIEVKLGLYEDACEYPLPGRLFDNRFNSELNNQLTLRYRALRSVPRLTPTTFLAELPHAAPSPYVRDDPRACHKTATLELLRDIRDRLRGFYLVALTLDDDSPLLTMQADHQLYPIFFRQDTGTVDDFPNVGVLSWRACADLFDGLENHFTPSYERLLRSGGAGDELGEVDDRFLKGRHIVYYHGEPCLLSVKGYSYAVHRWVGNRFRVVDEGSTDRAKLDTLRPLVRHIEKAPRENMKNATFWTAYFAALPVMPAAETQEA